MMGDDADDDADGRKGRLTRIWGGAGAVVIGADTEFLHPYTIASYIFFLLGAVACLRALSFDLPLRLERIRSAVSHAVKGRRAPQRTFDQGVEVQTGGSGRYAELAIGILAMLLPFVLIFGARITGGPALASLSDYYYSPMRDVFVGSFCVLGALLISYRSNSLLTRSLTIWAGLSCIGWALFPVAPAEPSSHQVQLVAHLHLIFVVLTYTAFTAIGMSFAQTKDASAAVRMAYVICTLTMFAFFALSFVPAVLPGRAVDGVTVVLSAESAALTAAGASWFVRGSRAALQDPAVHLPGVNSATAHDVQTGQPGPSQPSS
jgi:hypothetical protein